MKIFVMFVLLVLRIRSGIKAPDLNGKASGGKTVLNFYTVC